MKKVVYKVKSFEAGASGHLPTTWVAYTLSEGEYFSMLGLDTEEEADEVVERYKADGTMLNPRRHVPNAPEVVEPASMMKLKTNEYHYSLPTVVDVEEELETPSSEVK